MLNKLAKDPTIVMIVDRILARQLSSSFDEIEDQWRRDLLMEDELARVILGGPIPASFEAGQGTVKSALYGAQENLRSTLTAMLQVSLY